MTKMHMGNWTKMSVINGGTGNLTLGPSTGFPSAGETIGTNKRFHYVILATNLAPLEAGAGVMTDIVTLRRDEIKAKMVAGVYSEGDALTPVNIPVGALMFSAPTEEMLNDLVLEMALTDYGNVSGATGISLRNKAVKLNLTADATLSFNDLPPAGVKYELTLHATSANAGTAQLGKGFMLTLPSSCKLGKNSCPPIPLTHDTETVLTLITSDAGASWQAVWNNANVNVNDLGDFAEQTSMALDIRYPQSRGRFVSVSQQALTFSGVAPAAAVGEPAHFSFVNDGSVSKIIIFDANVFTVIGSTVSSLLLPIGYKLDFTVRKNPNTEDSAAAYDVWVNGINYNQTASGLVTTFNPSDKTANAVLSSGNRTLANTVSANSTANSQANARAFGAKNSGIWKFCVRIDQKGTRSDTTNGVGFVELQVGIASAGHSISQDCGATPLSYAYQRISGKYNIVAGSPTQQWGRYSNNVFTQAGFSDVDVNDFLHVIFNADTNKVWFARNGVPFNATIENILAGTNEAFNTVDAFMLPMVSHIYAGSGNSNLNMTTWRVTIMDEIQDPYFPSIPTWTA